MDITKPLDDLSTAAIDSKPVNQDWSENTFDEDVDGWRFRFYETDTATIDGLSVPVVVDGSTVVLAQDSNGVWVNPQDHDDYDNTDDDGEEVPGALTDDQLDELSKYTVTAEGPMMNYWYPVGVSFTPEEAAKLTGSLCLVDVDGATGLALTGGGMNLSWEICEAFIELGYLPPTHFSDLPAGADTRALSPAQAYIVRAMLKSLSTQQGWLKSAADRLAQKFPIEGTPAA